MSNSLDNFLTRIGDVTIERVTPRGEASPSQQAVSNECSTNTNMNTAESQNPNDESSEESSGETTDGDQDKKHDPLQSEEIEEIRSEGSGDDMDLDETIDSHIGVRVESERQQHHSSPEEDDEEPVNILDTLPLEGAPIEGQEVSEADLLGKPLSKDTDDDEDSIDNENEKMEHQVDGESSVEGNKRHTDSEHSDTAKKKQKKDESMEGSSSECELKAEKKLANMRRNIREVMDETQLDEATLSAQRQEMERLRRVQEQQRIIREVQRQIAINRQNNKTQTRVISLLQGKQNQSGTTISQSSSSSSLSSTQVRLPSTVLLKVNSASGAGLQSPSSVQTSQMQRRTVEGMRWQKGRGVYQGAQTSISRVPNRATGSNMLQQRIRMMTPSVSISPVIPKKEPIDRSEYYSDSEISDIEAEEAMREKQLHAMRKTPGSLKSSKTAKGKDVVTISSSSESSDDDCIVLSDPSGEEETDNEDDPSNSGMHTNDRYNIPDEHGRVLINVGHPESEPDVFLAPQVARIIKPHQIGGIRFLYDNIVESIERYKTSSGFGCILAHSMGLGKTLQVASFCDIFFRCTTAKTVLCIMPINTLQNWLAEFNMWLPYEDPNAEKGTVKGPNVKMEAGIEPKQEIKEECGSQSDLSNMSRPISTESAHRFCQDSTSQPISMPENHPYQNHSHQGYDTHNVASNYVQDTMMNKGMVDSHTPMSQNYQSDMSQNSLYNTNSSLTPNFDPTQVRPTNMPLPKFTTESPNPGNVYAGIESRAQQPPMYQDMENRHSVPMIPYSTADPRNSAPMYSNYDGSTTIAFQNYMPPQQNPESDQEPRKENILPPQNVNVLSSQNPSIVSVKTERDENHSSMRKGESTSCTKEEIIEEKKEVEKVRTPLSVDAPIGLDFRPRHFRLHILNDSHKTMTARAKVIQEWQTSGGVLLIGYELYRQLSLKKPNKAKRKRGQSFKDTVDVEEEDKNKGLLDDMHGALVSPGPDLVICDEGHRIKNSHASISMALKQMRTKRRIVLTGYPLQNNLLEYWCMVDFVRPNYLGTKSEFCNMFERPIQNGQCIDSTPQDIRLMRYRAHVLHALLEGFVQRRSHSVLQVSLPRKEEYILLVRMTPHQRKLYDTFMNQVVKTRAVPNPLKAFAVCCKIWNHPDILYHFLRKRQANEEDDLDLEETIGEKSAPGSKRSKARQPKGETKKGKKTNTIIKNKPAASVQPNASSSSSNTDTTVESENTHINPKPNNYPNYPVPMSNSGYTNTTVSQGSYPHGYQNYRSNEQGAYYRNDNNHTEYNDFYGNQNQQRYGNQSFQGYSQAPGYTNSTQGYQNQTQNYMPAAEQPIANHPQRYPTAPPPPDFRPEQNQPGSYETSGIFPRQSYPYQDQGRSYTPAINQGTNNYGQVSHQSTSFQQLPSQPTPNIPISDYSSYGAASQTQNYVPPTGQTNSMYPRNDHQQPLQNSTVGYTGGNPSNPNTTSQPPASSGYLPSQQTQNSTTIQPRGFSPNQQSPNLGLQTSGHGYVQQQQSHQQTHQQPHQQSQSQSLTHQNQSHGYAGQIASNPSSQVAFNQQTSSGMSQPQSHVYAQNQSSQTPMAQNQIRYSPGQAQLNMPQNTNSYNATSGQQPATSNASTPHNHGFASDQQSSAPSVTNTMHGYGHQNQTPPYTSAQQGPASAQSSSAPGHGYPSSHQAQPIMPQVPAHRYPTTPQQGQQHPPTQSQPLPYSPSQQQTQTSASLNQNDQIYSRPDGQQQQQQPAQQPYTANTNAPHEFSNDRQVGGPSATTNPIVNYSSNQTQTSNSVMSTYSTDQNQVGQIKGADDSYWQRNYPQTFRSEQCNDSYYRDQNVNRYQNQNYFPSQNYPNQTYDYGNNRNSSDIGSRSDDNKSQPGTNGHGAEKNNKDMTASVGVQSQPIHQNNLPNPQGFGTDASCQNSLPSRTGSQGLNSSQSPRLSQNDPSKEDEREKEDISEKDKEDKSDDEILTKDEEKDSKSSPGGKDDPGIPYDWATELMKGYVPGLIDASAKMTLFFCILEEAIRLGDRVLAFSQSLFTLNLIEDFLARNNLKYPDGQTDAWIKNVNYYRLDGSTSALEREKLINEFNSNPKIHLFLVSTRAGSLGINLVGANRAIVFDASWNPCHDTQAVCRVYRYGQQKPCFVYRLVTDNCLERKIYDRQISKQGMADRVVDQCNPDAHLSLKEATTLSWDWEEDSQVQDFSQTKDSYSDEVMHCVLDRHSSLLTKQPFHHESLLVDRKDKKLSQAEKRLARRGYELEKMAANCSRPSYNYVPGNTATRGGLQIRAIRGGDGGTTPKPVASVRPMQQRGAEGLGSRSVTGSRWIPAEVWQRQGMSAQEMTLPLDVVIPTNSPDKGSIVLKAGQRVMVLKSPKGIYMQLESGKIIAIRTALKLNQQKREEEPKKGISTITQRNSKSEVGFPLRNNSAISIIPKSSSSNQQISGRPLSKPGIGPGYRPFADKEISKRPKPVATAAAKPYMSQVTLTNQVSLSRLSKVKQEPIDHSTLGENSNSSDSQVRTEQRVEEVRLEDVVAEVSSNTDYSPNNNRTTNSDTDGSLPKSSEEGTQVYPPTEPASSAQIVQTQPDATEQELASKIDHKQCSPAEEKESMKSDTLPPYGHSFNVQPEKKDATDEIIIEEPQAAASSTSTATSVQPVTSHSVPTTVQAKIPQATRVTDASKSMESTSSVTSSSVCTGTNTLVPSPKVPEAITRDGQAESTAANVPQGYPYAQYPRYYEYTDPRSRSLSAPYGTYFPAVPPHSANPRLPTDTTKQLDTLGKPAEERVMSVAYTQPSSTAKVLASTGESKILEPTVASTTKSVIAPSGPSSRDEAHVPTAFSHPTSTRYPSPYPPGPYDPYSQHYPPAPGSSATYPPAGAPGYPAYGGPTYNTEYARMYSAFHGPPPTDPYIHRGYAPPSSHPPNYYPPFPHPPPPYPNYSFLSPYPNPNMPSEPQPPAQ